MFRSLHQVCLVLTCFLVIAQVQVQVQAYIGSARSFTGVSPLNAGRYVRHDDYIVKLGLTGIIEDTWIVVPCLMNLISPQPLDCISLRAGNTNLPDYYLRHKDFRALLQNLGTRTGAEQTLFYQDSSFIMKQIIVGSGGQPDQPYVVFVAATPGVQGYVLYQSSTGDITLVNPNTTTTSAPGTTQAPDYNLVFQSKPPVVCPSGYAGSPSSGVPCVVCSHGRYTNQSSLISCLSCPANTTSLSSPPSSQPQPQTSCTKCPPFSMSRVGGECMCLPGTSRTYSNGTLSPISESLTCTPCAAGTYSDQLNAISCTSCSAGTFSNQIIGSTSCIPCPIGQTSRIQSTTCTDQCAPGYYQYAQA